MRKIDFNIYKSWSSWFTMIFSNGLWESVNDRLEGLCKISWEWSFNACSIKDLGECKGEGWESKWTNSSDLDEDSMSSCINTVAIEITNWYEVVEVSSVDGEARWWSDDELSTVVGSTSVQVQQWHSVFNWVADCSWGDFITVLVNL